MKKISASIVVILLSLPALSEACSNTRLSTPEGDIIGRTMELSGAADLASVFLSFDGLNNTISGEGGDNIIPWQLAVHPAQQAMGGNPICHDSSSWHNKNSFVSIDLRSVVAGIGEMNVATDGMNAAGLTVSAQTFREAEYQQPPPEVKASKTSLRSKQSAAIGSPAMVCWVDLPGWILGNFDTVADLTATLKDPRKVLTVGARHLVRNAMADLAGLYTHWSVDDAHGGHVVIEYLHGQLHVHNNTVGTMTNDPPFDWHLRNLNNYVNLNAQVPTGSDSIRVDSELGVVPRASGHGTNTLGLPGDYTSTSRFVKLFYLKQFAMLNNPVSTIEAGISTVTGLLNTVYIPKGVVAEKRQLVRVTGSEFTQYSVMKVPQRRTYYYKDYYDTQWRMLDLTRLNFKHAKFKPITEGQLGVKDTTGMFD